MMKVHAAFEYIGKHTIDSLNLTVEHYQHRVTGATHYHLVADDSQNVFLVALRTVPMDSTGIAHILEHTTLCGSEKYPVRDPFFMMIRRSLNTFMNAFTSSDWTAYPFATENRKDFQNLLQVYMDAVFFPNLHALDFAQEGHRFEFEDKMDSNSPLTYKGVVFNEMKGAMSSPISTLWQTLSTALYPTNTYHYNSGGDPEDIPDLTHQQLLDFHKNHYHPSNAVFMTYGDTLALQHQTEFEALALGCFKDTVPQVHVGLEQRISQPKSIDSIYALDEDEIENKTHIVLGWLLGENKDPLQVLKGHLLSAVLLDNSASPLRMVLENYEFATAPSPLCGFEESHKEMLFVVGIQGSELEHAQAVETLILTELERIADEGVEQSQVEAMLHQLELSQREVGGDASPYGLQLILHALPGALHEGDPIALLDSDQALKALGAEVKDPQFIPRLVKSLLLENNHRIRLTMSPDIELSAEKNQAEKDKLTTIKAKLSQTEKQDIVDQAVALEVRQSQVDNPDVLPEVTKKDIPKNIKTYCAKTSKVGHVAVTSYQCGSNGLSYAQVVIDLPTLTNTEKALMPIFNNCFTEVGSGGRNYLETQSYHAEISGGINARLSIHSKLQAPQDCHAHFILSSKALNTNQDKMVGLIEETLYTARFNETVRLKDLVGQIRASVDHGITDNGHGLAMMTAVQNFTPASQWSFQRSGFAGIQYIKTLNDELQGSDQALEAFSADLSAIQEKLCKAPKQALIISDEKGLPTVLANLDANWSKIREQNKSTTEFKFKVDATQKPINQAWVTSTQVNFCALAFPAVVPDHKDAAKLAVLGACLRNGFLHSIIREKGGAYGGGASYNSEASAFVFYSYRDPRLLETYADFNRAKDWLMSSEATQAKVDEAILNVISAMDKPGSPAGEVKKAFYQNLYGRSYEVRMTYREGVITSTLEELREVADCYLSANNASSAVLTNAIGAKLLEDTDFEIIVL